MIEASLESFPESDESGVGRSPGPRPTPSSASGYDEQPDQGSGADAGVRPTFIAIRL